MRRGLWLKTTEVAVKGLNNLPEFTDEEEMVGFYKEIETLRYHSKPMSHFIPLPFVLAKHLLITFKSTTASKYCADVWLLQERWIPVPCHRICKGWGSFQLHP